MAKKNKKRSKAKRISAKKRKNGVVAHPDFWPITGAIIMLIVALFLLLGGFGTGGKLPVEMFKGVYWTLGWAAYTAPIALLLLSFRKLRSKDKRAPLAFLASIVTLLVFLVTWLHVAFADKVVSEGVTSYYRGNGGEVGKLFGDIVLTALNKVPASILFFTATFLMFFLTFGISLKIVPRVFSALRLIRPKERDTDLAELKANARQNEFKLNEGVPIEHNIDRAKSPGATLKNTAKKLAPDEDHEALTVARDPDWKYPSISLLSQKQDKTDPGDVEGNADIIKETFTQFNISVVMEGANVGPRVTQFTLKPPTGVKLTKMTALENNLALDLAAHSIRMEAPIPGKRLVGIEVPNIKSATVRISSLLQSNEWKDINTPLGFVIGKDTTGTPIVADLATMPHLLVAGQTGSGKSVMINTILTSLLYHNSPADLKLILVDPKQVELTPYNDIPHLLTPVINKPEECISALKWAVAEMERRLRTMAEAGRRNIVEYNNLKKEDNMPYIVIVIDELSDLMMMAARDVEALVVRIAQKARAAGIHLVLATQRPSVDVITGLIKANVPARIAFTTSSQVDSRTIIDKIGAEKLLGQGDMLLLTSSMPKPKRVQGAFIDDAETLKINDFIREQRPPQYNDEVTSQQVQLNGKGGIVADYGANEADDDMWRDAVTVVVEGGKASTSLLQRRLRIGYGRAARLIETMEEQGIIGGADGNRPREVLVASVDEVFNAGKTADEQATDDEVLDENFPEA